MLLIKLSVHTKLYSESGRKPLRKTKKTRKQPKEERGVFVNGEPAERTSDGREFQHPGPVTEKESPLRAVLVHSIKVRVTLC